MTQMSDEFYEVFDRVLKMAGKGEAEIKQRREEFEKEMFKRLILVLVQKLPEQERKGVIDLMNGADTDDKRAALNKKLEEWFNEAELDKVFKKTADGLFKEMLQNLYQDATGEQRGELEKLFTAEALGK